MDKQAFIAAVKAAGIVGEGGAGFPAHVKYAADADTVIANGCECEPLLHTDQHHMLHHANEIVRAFSELMQATGAKRGVIALKKKYKEATKILTDAIGNRPIELALLPNFYPAGDEQTLVREVTGRSVPPLGLPLMVGAVVANVGTLVSVAHALDGKPVTHKFLTVTGEVKKPGIVCVPIGTPLSACLEAAGGPTVSDPVFVLGGPMMGRMVDNADAFAKEVVTKTSGGLIILPRGHYLHRNATTPLNFMRRRAASAPLILTAADGHGAKADAPAPNVQLLALGTQGNAELIQRLTAEAGRLALLCCDCGVCEHVACPMGLSPRRINQAIKNELRAAGMKYEGSRDVNEAYTQWREFRRVPVPRLVNKIGISRYMELPTNDLGALSPAEVRIPLRQHIGAPAQAVVKAGDRVKCGDVIGEIPEQGLGARIHASMDGVVKSVDGAVVIGK
mgnify:CR=1 FL=1